MYWLLALWTMAFPLIANSWGWIFTEMGRQPWVVYGVMHDPRRGLPGVSTAEVARPRCPSSPCLYAVLAVIEVKLLGEVRRRRDRPS